MTTQNVRVNFQENLIKLAKLLNHAYGLKITECSERPFDHLIRWMDFRLRYIDPKPREVLLARHLQLYFDGALKKPWTGEVELCLHRLFASFELGSDINHMQSKTLVRNDINQWDKDSQFPKKNRTDGLWADWGITHLHLSNEIDLKNPKFVKSADWQIFLYVTATETFVLDICKHKKGAGWGDEMLVKTMIRNWPSLTDKFALKGLKCSSIDGSDWTAEERVHLRMAGSSPMLNVDGQAYIPFGWGNTTANVPLIVMKRTSLVREMTQMLADEANDLNGQIMRDIIAANDCSNPIFLLALNANGLAVYEEQSKRLYQIPSIKEFPDSFMCKLRELFSPDWVIKKLVADGILNDREIHVGY